MKIRLLLGVVFFLGTLSLGAQSFRGGIQGTIVDSTGAAVPAAEITVSSTATGLVRTVQSDADGNFFVPELPLGEYSVKVSKSGFQIQTLTGVRVDASSSERLSIHLAAGSVEQVVNVSEAVPLVESTNFNTGGTISGETATEIPVNGRDFTKLLVMVPGATGDPSGATDSPGSFGLFSVNGNRGRSNNYLLDGTDMNDGYRNLPSINEAGVFGTPATVLPVDALAEVPVISNVEAQYGRNSGAIVNLVTKSGTNQLHGTLYEFFRDHRLDARNYFNAKPQPQNQFRNNQFGGSLGGPIVKDRSFFFVSYEGQRERVGIPSVGRVPDPVTDIAANGGPSNPVIAQLLARNPWPAPNQAPDAAGNNLQAVTRASNRVDSFIGKIDQHVGSGGLLTGRYFFGDSDQSFPLALLGGNVLPGYNTQTPTTVHVASVSYTHPITSRLLAEIRGGYNHFFETFFPEDKDFNPNSIGLRTTSEPRNFGLPLIRIAGFAPIGANASLPRGRTDVNSQLFGNMSYVRGGHNFKWGYEFRRTTVDGFFDAGYRGVIRFDSISDFLAGNISGGRQARGDSNRFTFQNNHSFYFQDNFQATSRLTLNYGVRWDYYGVLGEKNNRLSILDASRGLVQVGTNGLERLYPRDLNNFAPRLGFAYDLTGQGRTVVRGGWGVYYDAFSQDFFTGQLPFNTFNPGPAYNGIGPSPISFSFGPVATIQPNVPVFPDASFGISDVFTVDQKLRTPYIQNFNLNVQHQFGQAVALQVGYVGSQGRKLFRYRDINQGDPATSTGPFASSRPFDSGPFAPDGSAFFYVNQFESTAASGYNSLQSSLRIRAWSGLTSTINYTWSHSIDNASDGQDYVPNASQPDDSFRPDRERADSNFDTRHRFQWLWNFEFPNPAGMRWLTNGWALNGVVTLSSGMPFNVNFIDFSGDWNGTGEGFGRPDLVGDPFAGTSAPHAFLNLSAFKVPCTLDPTGTCINGTQHFGNLPRNAFVGPDFRNADFSLVKKTQLSERTAVELRADFFNLFNHPNFANPLLPNFGVDMTFNGLDAQGRGQDFFAITSTPDVAIGNPFLGGGGPRNIQLGVRLIF